MRQLLFKLLARHNSGELCCHATALVIQPSLCRTWSEAPKTGFLMTQLIQGIKCRMVLVVNFSYFLN